MNSKAVPPNNVEFAMSGVDRPFKFKNLFERRLQVGIGHVNGKVMCGFGGDEGNNNYWEIPAS